MVRTAKTTMEREADENRPVLEEWLRECRAERLSEMDTAADRVRRENCGDIVHFRGLIEISNNCRRGCLYCGLRAANRGLPRYRLPADEIVSCAQQAAAWGCGTVVLQAGEDPALTGSFVAMVIDRIRSTTSLAITLSLGERDPQDLRRWRQAGADRYLLRFETSNRELMRRIHPPTRGSTCNRVELLLLLRDLGYEIGSGMLIGLPGQSYADLAADVELIRMLDLDMIGVGPFLPHPATPLGRDFGRYALSPEQQAPADERTTLTTIALCRLACPRANIAVSTALSTLNRVDGRERGLQCGANVLMPNFTPACYRAQYEIYPAKSDAADDDNESPDALHERVVRLGRRPGTGRGDSPAFLERRMQYDSSSEELLR